MAETMGGRKNGFITSKEMLVNRVTSRNRMEDSIIYLDLIIHLVPLEKLENMRQENGYTVFKKKTAGYDETSIG
jgi:hypothetical protein